MRRILLAVIVLSLVLPSTGIVAGAAAGASGDVQTPAQLELQEPTAWSASAAAAANNSTTTAENTTTTPGSGSPLESAETARVSPVRFSEEWLSVEVVESDSRFNTSGPFVMFTITEPVDAVRISQQGAEAELLHGGQTVRVAYAEDAAPDPQNPSLYTLELYYADGSSEEIELYARETSVSVEAAHLQTYRQLIYDMRGDAKEAGYEKSPEGVSEYYENTKDRADLLDSLFVEQAAAFIAGLWMLAMNPVAIGATLLLVAVLSAWRMHRRGYTLDVIANDSGKAQRLRERLRIAYKQNQQTADEERLKELPKIGSMSEVYWRDAQGVSTVYQLAELARNGKMELRDGELVQVHAGVSELQAGSLEQTWLESVAGHGRHRVGSYDIALSHMKTALERMMSTYGMGHIYRDTYQEVTELIDARQQIIREGGVRSAGSNTGAAAAGGD